MKKILTLVLAALLILSLAACGSTAAPAEAPAAEAPAEEAAEAPVGEAAAPESVKLTVGASSTPHAELLELVKQKYMIDLFHDSLGFAAAKMIRRIVGVAHVEDFESISDPIKRADCERRALDFAKMLMKKRRNLYTISDVISAAQ